MGHVYVTWNRHELSDGRRSFPCCAERVSSRQGYLPADGEMMAELLTGKTRPGMKKPRKHKGKATPSAKKKAPVALSVPAEAPELIPSDPALLADVRKLIDSARGRVAVTVNAELTMLYWQIGRRLSGEVLKGK